MDKNVKHARAPVEKEGRKALTPEHIEKSLRLIRLVQAYPPLWSEPNEPNKNIAIKRTLWQAVASEMGEPVAKVFHHWKNLVSSYRRILNSFRNTDNPWVFQKRPWYAFEPMQFLQETIQQQKTVRSLPKNDSLKEEMTDSEIVTLVNIRDNTVVCKSIDELAAKPPEISPPTGPKPQTQVGNALRIDRRSQQWTKTPVRVKRTYPILVEDPLQIKQTPQTQPLQVEAPFQNVQRRSLGGRPTLNPSSVKSFVNLIEQELSEISSDYATMAQVDIYKIIGEYKLKDVRRSSEASSKPMKTKVTKQVAVRRIDPKPVKIAPAYSLGNNDMLEVALECEEYAS
uniref:MADF domain-containing protein n=1 Tax=Anopheles atroparvus TaxID=41427 RepID=A0AAG5CQR6_ANOAO